MNKTGGAACEIACDLLAIGSGERVRHQELANRLRSAIRQRIPVERGYSYQIDSAALSLVEIAEWMTMERLCCPFLTLQVAADGGKDGWLLTLSGPEGVTSLLDIEFPAA